VNDDPDERRYGPPLIFSIVLALLVWGRALYELAN
jgi:hypothetical protein